jgi:hypothetical protein
MQGGWYIFGEEVESFEREFAAYCGTRECAGTGNGLDALHLILRGYGIGAGDDVIVPAHTFIATWLAVTHAEGTGMDIQVSGENVRYGEHERIMAGLLAGCAVISDSTPHLDRTLERFPVFRGIATGDEIDHAITSLLTDPAIEDTLTASLALAREMFSLENFVNEVLSLLELERYRRTDLNWWAFPPRG